MAKKYITIDGLNAKYSNHTWAGAISAWGSDNVTIENCEVDYSKGSGIYWGEVSNTFTSQESVTNNIVNYAGTNGIYVDYATNALIRGNTVANTRGNTGIYVDSVTANGLGNVISQNTVHDGHLARIMHKKEVAESL